MAVSEQDPKIFVVPEQKSKKTLVDYAVRGGLLLLLFWGGKKIVQKIRHNSQEDKTGTDPTTQQAMSLRSAMNPSGFEWLRNVDGTDETTIFNTGKEITNLEDVIKAYRKLYNGASLTDDLQKEMGVESYKRFLNIFKFQQKESPKSKDKIKRGLIVITTAQTNVHKTPRASGSPKKDALLIFGRSNIIDTLDKGVAVGVTTGRTVFDEKAEPSGVLLMEVNILKTNASAKDGFSAWVAASQVETITVAQFKQKPYHGLSISQELYDKASSSLAGTDTGADFSKEIITVSQAPVLDEEFKQIGRADKGIILGFEILELSTKDNVFVKFLTVDGTQRWVNKKLINKKTNDTF